MSKALERLRIDKEAIGIVSRAAKRNQRYGSGDNMDFALLVIDETRKQEKENWIQARTAQLLNEKS